jgi:undecaprenyl pyrophosphate phosphatase UppP
LQALGTWIPLAARLPFEDWSTNMPTMALSLIALVAVIASLWLINAYVPLPGRLKEVVKVVLALIVIGIVLWLINTYIPMAGSIKAILNIVVVIATCVGVLQAVGLWDEIVGFVRNFRAHRIGRGHRVFSPPEPHA